MLGMSCPTSWQLEDRFIELDAVGRQFELELCPYRPQVAWYRWRPCGVTCDAVPEQCRSINAAANHSL